MGHSSPHYDLAQLAGFGRPDKNAGPRLPSGMERARLGAQRRLLWGVSMADNKYVIFRLANERYGLPIESVERILPTQDVTRLPRTPKMLLGVFEMRGATVPAIDARLRFDLEASGECKNFVVVMNQVGRCALSVDHVDGIITLDDSQIEENSAMFDSQADDFIRGIGRQDDHLLVLLEPEGIVPAALRKKVAAAAA